MQAQMMQKHIITHRIMLFFKNAWKAYKHPMINVGEIQANMYYPKE